MHWLLVGILALAPLPAGANRPAAWSILALAVAMLVAVDAVVTARGRTRSIVVPRTMRIAAVIFLMFVATICLQLFSDALLGISASLWQDARLYPDLAASAASATINPFATQTALMKLLTYAAMFWLTYKVGHSRRNSHVVLLALTTTITALSLHALAEYFDFIGVLFDKHYQGVPTGSFVNRNNFATYMGFGVILSLSMLQYSLAPRTSQAPRADKPADLLVKIAVQIGLLTSFFMCATALLLSQSRGALIGVAAALAFLLLGHWRPFGQRWLAPLVPCVLAIVFAMLVFTSGAATLDRFDRIEIYRLEIWRAALAGLDQNAFLGTGYGTFRESFRMAKDDAALADLHYAHNTYIDLAMTAGLIGATLLLAAIAAVVVHCWLRSRARGRSAIAPSAAVAIAVLAAFHSLVDFSLQIPAIALTFAAILGLGSGVAAARGHTLPTGPR